MKRQLNRWLHVGFKVLLLSTVCSAFGIAGDDLTDAWQKGISVDSMIKGKIGSGLSMQQNLLSPLTGGSGANLNTFDGTESGSVNFTVPSSKAFLKVSAIPALSGDIATLVVSEDSDLDGSIDHTVTYSNISGVCANGAISCTPGTWSDCNFMVWDASPDGKLKLAPAKFGAKDLAGCYCINNYCGKGLAIQNLDIVLQDLGAGAAGGIAKWDRSFSITSAKMSSGTISYYGQKLANVHDSKATQIPGPGEKAAGYLQPSGTSTPMDYSRHISQFQAPVAFEADATSTMQYQAAQPDSYYALLSRAQATQQMNQQSYNCTVRRNVVAVSGQNYCAEPKPENILGSREETNYWKLKLNSTILFGNNDGGPCYTGADWGFKRDSNMLITSWVFKCTGKPAPEGGPYQTSSGIPAYGERLGKWADMVGPYVNVDGDMDICFYDMYDYYTQCVRKYDMYQESIDSTQCDGYAVNTDCQLRDSTVDGVKVWVNFQPTGLNPMPSVKGYTGSLGTYVVSMPWWIDNRTYVCTTRTGFDFSSIEKRKKEIDATSGAHDSNGSLAMTYTDLRKDDSGQWTSSDVSTILGRRPAPGEDCEMACKVKKPIPHNDVAVAGVPIQLVTEIDSFTFYYKVCNPSCVVEDGETIVSDCACPDDFNNAVSAIQILSEAKKDMICSQTN